MTSAPIAVGGVGGSGTRIIAQLLLDFGVFMGNDLNASNDNLWYAVLFGRRNVFLENQTDINYLIDLFFTQMRSPSPLSASDMALLNDLLSQERHQHSPQDLAQWLASFVAQTQSGQTAARWGWKMPYSFVVIEKMLLAHPQLKYVHINRNALDMAFSANQNQLGTWGPIFLNRNVDINPTESLSYWCAVHRFTAKIKACFPDRFYDLSFDELVVSPDPTTRALLHFLEIPASDAEVAQFCDRIIAPASVGRHTTQDMGVFRQDDLQYLQTLGYDIPT